MTDFNPPREVDPADIELPEEYKIEAVVTSLTLPADVAFGVQGGVYVTEGGDSYGDVSYALSLKTWRQACLQQRLYISLFMPEHGRS